MKILRAKTALWFLSILVVAGMAACSTSSTTEQDEDTAKSAATRAESSDEAQASEQAEQARQADSDIVPVGESPVLGPADAPVTIVEFADYQCPFCSKSHRTVEEISDEYGDDVRVVFKHYPLPFHQQAEAASRAAIAAGKQGKFWEMHDLLFRYQKVMKGKSDAQMKDWSAGFAAEMGLDVEQFRADFDADSTTRQIEEDVALAKELGVKGTPQFFVNGERLKGAQPMPKFTEIIDAELEAAEQSGEELDTFYRVRVEANFEEPSQPKPKAGSKRKTRVSYVPIEDNDPVKGATQDPLVTVVAFSDFQCPFCAKVVPTLEKIEKEYPDRVRIVFKQLPLAMHAQADLAAEIALAAQEQGKFWEMHDLLFERQREMRGKSDEEMIAWGKALADELGLDADALSKSVANRAHKDEIDHEREHASDVGARGTPNFWINGKNLRGAQPYPKFKAIIDEQLDIAKQLQKDEGLEGEALYQAAVEYNAKNVPEVAEPERPQRPPTQVDVSKLVIDSDQVKGGEDYDVTIFAFADYECPFCNRGHDNLESALGQVNADVRVVFKHYPLPFHKNAEAAAIAAMAAGEQGKFWEMSELLFEHQNRLGEQGIYEELAKQIGLNTAKFKADMKSNETKYKKQIKNDMTQGKQIGVRGTPAYFVDGELVVGAQPTQKFVDVINKKAKESDE